MPDDEGTASTDLREMIAQVLKLAGPEPSEVAIHVAAYEVLGHDAIPAAIQKLVSEAAAIGGVKREDFSELIASDAGPIPSDGMIVVDFVLMGRDAANARRGFAEVVWKRDREKSTAKINVVMPEASYPLGDEPDLTKVTPSWIAMSNPVPVSCDVCGKGVPPRQAVNAFVLGPTFEGSKFKEMLTSCGSHQGPLVKTQTGRQRMLMET